MSGLVSFVEALLVGALVEQPWLYEGARRPVVRAVSLAARIPLAPWDGAGRKEGVSAFRGFGWGHPRNSKPRRREAIRAARRATMADL